MVADEVRHLAEVGEQPQVGGGQRRKRQPAVGVGGAAVDAGSRPPVGRQPRAEAITRIARLDVDVVARLPPVRPQRAAIEQIEQRHAGADQDVVAEEDRVVDGELQPTAPSAEAARTRRDPRRRRPAITAAGPRAIPAAARTGERGWPAT